MQVYGRQRPEPSNTNHPNPFVARKRQLQEPEELLLRTPRNFEKSGDTAVRRSENIEREQREEQARLAFSRLLFYDIKAAIARGFHLFPFRTEKLNPAAPMVLRKWESR